MAWKEYMTASNPYESPAAVIAETRLPLERDVPEEISRPIKHGWVAACVSCGVTLIATLIARSYNEDVDYYVSSEEVARTEAANHAKLQEAGA